MQIRIVGTELPGRECGPDGSFPGYTNIHVGVQRKNRPGELLDLHPGDAEQAVWTVECKVVGRDVRGDYIQGPPGGRFIYLTWCALEDSGRLNMFRRAKLMLEDVPAEVFDAAAASGLLIGRLGLTDAKGHPLCARVQPGRIKWTAL